MNAALNKIKDEPELFAGDLPRADGSYLDALRDSGKAYKVISDTPEMAITRAASGIKHFYGGSSCYNGRAITAYLPKVGRVHPEHIRNTKSGCDYGIFSACDLNHQPGVKTWDDMFSCDYTSSIQSFDEEVRQHLIAFDGTGIMYPGGAEPPDALSLFDASPFLSVDTSSYIAAFKKQHLLKLIKDARATISGLEEDWDGEGAEALEPATFEAAATFLTDYFEHLLDVFGSEIELPEINACSNGSIDLEWHAKGAQLLINIRRKGNEYHAYYYGDRYNSHMPIKGSVPVAEFSDFLAVWMKYLA